MKNDPLIAAVTGALCVGAVVTFLLAIGCEYNFRRLRRLQSQFDNAQYTRARVNALADDAAEYGKRNPAINPILQAIVAKTGQPAVNPTAKPASK